MSKKPNSSPFNYYSYFLKQLKKVTEDQNPGKTWIENGFNCYVDFTNMFIDFLSTTRDILTWPDLPKNVRSDLEKLYDMVENYDYQKEVGGQWVDMTDQEICMDPKWNEIRQFAKVVHDEFKDLYKE